MTITALVDGGGTKTRVRFLNNADQTVITEVVTGPSNLGLGAEVCWQQIHDAVDLAGLSMPAKCVVGIAGSEYLRQRAEFLAQASCQTVLVSDRDAGLFGAHKGRPGGCLTVGTGVAFAWIDHQGNLAHRGGFGFVLGDQGGGAWIGWRVLQELVRLSDRNQLDLVHHRLIIALGIGETANHWVQFANEAGPRAFALLARAVVDSEDKVPLAAEILTEGLQLLWRLIEDFPGSLPLSLVGGLSTLYGPRLAALGYQMVDPEGDALDGLRFIDQHLDHLIVEHWISDA